jgi:hypothetical protein
MLERQTLKKKRVKKRERKCKRDKEIGVKSPERRKIMQINREE